MRTQLWGSQASVTHPAQDLSVNVTAVSCNCLTFDLATSENTKQAGCHHKLHAGENIFRRPRWFCTCDRSGWIKQFFWEPRVEGHGWGWGGLCSIDSKSRALLQSELVRVCVCARVVLTSQKTVSPLTRLTEGNWGVIITGVTVHRELKNFPF